MRNHASDLSLQGQGCEALTALAGGESSRIRISDLEGIIGAVLNAIRNDTLTVQIPCLKFLGGIATNVAELGDTNFTTTKQIVESGGIEAVLSALGVTTPDALLVNEGCAVFERLADFVNLSPHDLSHLKHRHRIALSSLRDLCPLTTTTTTTTKKKRRR